MMSDGKKSLKFVGFNIDHQKKLADHFVKKESVSLHSISVQKVGDSVAPNDVELMISGIVKSGRKFEIDESEWQRLDPDNMIVITLNQLQNQVKWQRVCVIAKVVAVDEVTRSASNKSIQELLLADCTGGG